MTREAAGNVGNRPEIAVEAEKAAGAEIRNPKLEIRNPKLEIRNKSEVRMKKKGERGSREEAKSAKFI
jgi:hypothetical protein